MNSINLFLLITISICIMLSAYFSSTETAFSSLNKARLKSHIKAGNKRAILVSTLSERFDKVLSTILIGNNIVNIVSASLSTVLFTNLMVGDEAAAITTSTVVMTIVVLIFGEITPKILAKENPEKVAMLFAPLLNIFMIILCPLNYPFSVWKNILNSIFKFQKDKGLTNEELINIVEETEQLGGMDEHVSKLIQAAIKFDDCRSIDVLTPYENVVKISMDASKEEMKNIFLETKFSRIPVYDKKINQIVGLILERDFYTALLRGETSIQAIIKPLHTSQSNMKISELLRDLQTSKNHMSLVVDALGKTVGIITMEDIMEELVGEIWDEFDEISSIGENQRV